MTSSPEHKNADPIRVGPPDDECNDGNALCSRAMTAVYDYAGEMRDGMMPQHVWCQACRDNMPAVERLRAVRRARGGLTSALLRAARRVALD